MYIKVRVTPGVKIETVSKKGDDHFVMSVKEKPERNLANRRIMEIIAEHYKVSVGKVRIINGHHSGSKILSVDI